MNLIRVCIKCGKTYPLTENFFPVLGTYKDETAYRRVCRKCFNRIQDTYNDDCYHQTIRDNFRGLMNAIRHRAKKKNMEMNISIDYLIDLWEKQKGLCYYSGIPMTITRNDRNIVSVDRIDSSKGYIKGNVVLATLAVNRMKNAHSVEDFIELCRTVVAYADAKGLSPTET